VVRPKLEVEPCDPRRARDLTFGDLSHDTAAALELPTTAHLAGCAGRIPIESAQHHCTDGIEAAPDVEHLTAIRDPGLSPAPRRAVVETEALASMAVRTCVFLEEHAIIENEAHLRTRNALRAVRPLEYIPVTDPEIELPVFGRGALGAGPRGI
jgi:hypothetical protein